MNTFNEELLSGDLYYISRFFRNVSQSRFTCLKPRNNLEENLSLETEAVNHAQSDKCEVQT